MGTMTKMLIAVFIIHISLVYLGVASIPGTSLFDFISSPTDWDSNAFSALLSDLFFTVGGLAIIAGTFIIKSDLLVFAGLSGILYTFGKPLATLWSILQAQTNSYIASMVVSPIILLYFMTVVAWWRGRES